MPSTPRAASLPGFPVATGDRVTAAPVLCDLDADGKKEIIVGSTDSKLYVLEGRRLELSRLPA